MLNPYMNNWEPQFCQHKQHLFIDIKHGVHYIALSTYTIVFWTNYFLQWLCTMEALLPVHKTQRLWRPLRSWKIDCINSAFAELQPYCNWKTPEED